MLQSEFSKNQLRGSKSQDISNNSVVYQDELNTYTKSDAVLKIIFEFGGIWKLFVLFKLVPKSIRDWLYDLIAGNRYKLFGKMKDCMIPPEAIRHRFLN